MNTTHLPDKSADKTADKSKDKKPGQKDSSGGGMLAEDEPLHARARKMSSTDNNYQIRYEGNAVLWQGANRLEADVVDIDRDNGALKAHGHVVSQLLDKAQDDSKSKEPDPKRPATKPQARVFTIVRAPDLAYDDDKRVAEYTGGATLERSNMQVKAKEIRAFLRNDNSDDSSLDHAFADGHVQIHSTAPGRVRDGTSEHAEYYVDEDKVILERRPPEVCRQSARDHAGRQIDLVLEG